MLTPLPLPSILQRGPAGFDPKRGLITTYLPQYEPHASRIDGVYSVGTLEAAPILLRFSLAEHLAVGPVCL